ncbi:pR82 [rat cytomegalovirus strain Maastricht]|uniref:PR82 n=1 Tax=Rat cytomegalovirus (strain Maastricht) TaxID=79700 RepID=Q9DWC0_RCMVM|nr:pR82 [rat cytomegalovirus strain Maastricht]AAF99170.1 pR82 [rat cytomegalovirus strain Maastricht]WEG72003.1 tegument protein pp71 [Murid betaherpesvirus 2]
MAADRMIANPKDPASPYAYGKTQCLNLSLTNGPVFRPGESKRLKSGLSVATKSPAVICVAERTPHPRRRRPFAVKFTYLDGQEDLVNVSATVTNESASPRTHRTPESHTDLSVFALPLGHVPMNHFHIFLSTRPESRLKTDAAPFRVTPGNAAKNLVKVVLRNQRWERTPSAAFGTHITTVVFQVPGLRYSEYDTVHPTAASDPGVRLDRAELIGAAADVLRLYLIFDPRAPGSSQSPPSSLTLQLNFVVHGTTNVLRRNPEPLLSRRHDNGYEVRCPRTLYVKAGQTTALVIDTAYSAHGSLTAVFFPKDIPDAEMSLALWPEKRPLIVTLTARRDLGIRAHAVLGRVHLFPADSAMFVEPSSAQTTAQSRVRVQLTEPGDYPDTPPSPSEARDEDPDENRAAAPSRRPFGVDYPYERHEAGAAPTPDEEAVADFANLSLDPAPSRRRRRPLREVPPRRSSRDGTFDALEYNPPRADPADAPSDRDDGDEDGDAESFEDFVAGPFQVAVQDAEEERRSQRMILHFGPHFLSVRLAHLEPLMFTVFTPLLNEAVYFAEPGIDKSVVSFAVTGRFLNLPGPEGERRHHPRERPEDIAPHRRR